jgi:succinoglycan biosynthesis transport protein ExoP
MQILTALPSVRSPIVQRKGELRPSKLLSEPLRRLHATLQLDSARAREGTGPPRSILVVSADAGDGKSTVVAGLALVQREAGLRVAVVEADFRRPVMAKLLGVNSPHGLADVLAGTQRLDGALQQVERGSPVLAAAPAENEAGGGGVATVVESAEVGSLSVLVGGTSVSNPPALLARPAMPELLRSLSDEFDQVLIDAPPPLQVSDVLPLLGMVDGIVVVARAGHTREASAQRLMQLLARTASAPLLGIVANAVSRPDMERYGFSSGYGQRSWPRTLIGR